MAERLLTRTWFQPDGRSLSTYKKNGGIGGVPVVISLGPDGKGSGDEGDNNADDRADNIRSDGRVN